jgi:hypothetical protein
MRERSTAGPRRLAAFLILAAGIACIAVLPAPADEGQLQDLIDRFWAAVGDPERAEAAAMIAASGAPFDAVYGALRRGRTYSDDVPRGRLLRTRVGINGLTHPYLIIVPDDYTPDRTWPLRLDLHGGMGASEWTEADGAWARGWTTTTGAFVVLPAGWWDSMWWEWSQAENVEAILREVQATWNIDENRVVAYGGSDGGAALFFHAMRRPDRYTGYAGHVAPPDRLTRADFRPDGQMHPSNLDGQRFHLGFGELDRKVPLQHVTRYMELFQSHGAAIDWYVLAGQGHALTLPAEREDELAVFLWRNTRDPLPDRVSWATERVDRYARRSWLVIEELDVTDTRVDESNVLPRWGTPIQLEGPTVPRVPWGRVVVEREGNRFVATAERVTRFRLLLSPDEVDLSRNIVVEVNGQVLFDRRVDPSIETLLTWAVQDDDRTRLFAADVLVDVR